MKEKIREMQQAQTEQSSYTQQNFHTTNHAKATPRSEDDYIDFEEVK